MSVVRLAFLGTPEFARFHLESILNDPHYEVVGVVSQPDRPSGRHMHLTPSPVKKFALEKGLEVYTPESIKTSEAIEKISSWKAEAAVVVAYGQIVPQKFLDLFPLKVVNVHGSLLPRWRGAAPIQRAMQFGDKVTGVSLQVMVKKLDAGPVIGSYSLPIDDMWDARRLHDELMPLGAKLLQRDFMDYLRGNLTPITQNEELVTLAPLIDKAESKIDFHKPAREIRNQIRGMVLGPGSTFQHNGKLIKVWRAEIADAKGPPGQIVEVKVDEFTVACGIEALRFTEVQPASRQKMPVRDFLLGYKLKTGDQLS
jgi:methionyl-tRNA formyltransferase